jgi:hypothetical protein
MYGFRIYAGVNTLRPADMAVIEKDFNKFMGYVPRVTIMDANGDILGAGICTPAASIIRTLVGSNQQPGAAFVAQIGQYMDSLSYNIGFLPAKTGCKAVVTTPNYPPFVKTTSVPGVVNVDMDNDVGAGANISGTIRNSANQTIAGASIRIKGKALDRSVKAESDGTYLLPGLADGVYRLSVAANGYALAADKVIIAGESKVVNFAVIPCSGSIIGTVYSQKFPYPMVVSGARVIAYDDTVNGADPSKELAIYETVTDKSGNYKIAPVIEGHTYKVALAVPGKAVQVYSPSPDIPTAPGSAAVGIDFTYKSVVPKIDLVARVDGNTVVLSGESPKKLVSLTAKYNEGATYNESSAAALTITTIGQKGYSVTLPDKTKSYAVRFTANDGASSNELEFAYNPNNLAQAVASIDQQIVTSGDVLLDSEGNDMSGLFISPGAITLGSSSVPEVTMSRENRTLSAFASAMPANLACGDVYHVDINMDGSQQNTGKTMTLTVGYNPDLAGDNIGSLGIFQYNAVTSSWDQIMGSAMVDPISGTVSMEVESIQTAAADSANAPHRKAVMAQFDGKEYKLSPKGAGSSNQSGIFMIGKVATTSGSAYAGSSLEVFNVPNPFNLTSKTIALTHGGSTSQLATSGTLIRFAVPSSYGTNVKTRFRIYNIAGELVREINANETITGGINGGYYYYIEWDGKNSGGEKCASGVYLCVAEVGSEKKVIKMALVK